MKTSFLKSVGFSDEELASKDAVEIVAEYIEPYARSPRTAALAASRVTETPIAIYKLPSDWAIACVLEPYRPIRLNYNSADIVVAPMPNWEPPNDDTGLVDVCIDVENVGTLDLQLNGRRDELTPELATRTFAAIDRVQAYQDHVEAATDSPAPDPSLSSN